MAKRLFQNLHFRGTAVPAVFGKSIVMGKMPMIQQALTNIFLVLIQSFMRNPKKLVFLIILLLDISVCWAAGDAPREMVVRLLPGPPTRVSVYRKVNGKLKLAAPILKYRHRGKMASAADIDADGKLDLLVLVYKKTRYDKKRAWRPFVFTLQEGRWIPKWLGSRVGRPLMEAILLKTSAGIRLLTVERCSPGKTVLTLYHWRGFGFWGEWTSEPMPAVKSLQANDKDGDGMDEISMVEFGGPRRWFKYTNGKLVKFNP